MTFSEAAQVRRVTRFIDDGMPAEKFTEALYHDLSNMFGHIDTDKAGFAACWFNSSASRFDFILNIVDYAVETREEEEIRWHVLEQKLLDLWAHNSHIEQKHARIEALREIVRQLRNTLGVEEANTIIGIILYPPILHQAKQE